MDDADDPRTQDRFYIVILIKDNCSEERKERDTMCQKVAGKSLRSNHYSSSVTAKVPLLNYVTSSETDY